MGRPGSSKSTIIALAGGSGSGKSWLAGRLVRELGDRAAAVSLDSFYRDRSHLPPRRRERVNYDHPRAIDWEQVERTLRRARAGRSFEVPVYSYAEHAVVGRPVKRGPAEFVIVEGLWVLRSRRLWPLIDLGIFVDAPARLRLERRIERDLAERGRSRASITRQFREQVEPMHRRFVEPQRRRADLILKSPIDDRAVKLLLRQLDQLRSGWPDSRDR